MSYLAIPFQVFPQVVCNGILGKPIVNISFGAGTNPGHMFGAATSVYKYVGTDCPADGSYTVRNNTTGCFFNDWHTLTRDHTGDSSGYFLLINTSLIPNDFYLDSVHNLCSSTTYEFSAWILNLVKPTSCGGRAVRPNINFSVEKTNGTLLESFTTNDIQPSTSAEWKRYAFNFHTVETNIVLRMTSINQGGCGGDFAVDDIALTPCVANVKTPPESNNNQHPSRVYQCKSKDTTFTFNSYFNNIYNEVGYVWQSSIDSGKNWLNIPGANQPSYSPYFSSTPKEELFLFRLNVGEIANLNYLRCLVPVSIDSVISVTEPIPASVSNSPICAHRTLIMSSSGGSQYTWNGPNGFHKFGETVSAENLLNINSGKYFVNVTSQYGCSKLDSLSIIVNKNPKAFAGNDTSICEGGFVRLMGNGGGKYYWTPSSRLTNPNIPDPYATPTETTIYLLKVTDTNNCIDSSSITVRILKRPIANAGPDKTIMQGDSTQLGGMFADTDVSYFWTPNLNITNTSILRPFVFPLSNISYTLYASSKNGCGTSLAYVNVNVITHPKIPNVFSPNNDGINDTWIIQDLAEYNSSEVSIFNRYGQKVFFSYGYNKPWDGRYNGKELPIGTYYYVIDLKKRNIILQGSVTILK